ncbi:hypothetical protein HMPREF9413_1342 [Paenibacillus sp. HGF7]|nr:hypothetical protein HMPREF9413_1342 [Paenibacillus sp. HGF7]
MKMAQYQINLDSNILHLFARYHRTEQAFGFVEFVDSVF